MGHLRNAQELTDQHQELTGQPGARGAVPPAALELTGRLAPGRLLGDCWETAGRLLGWPSAGFSGAVPERRAAHRGAGEASSAEPSARSPARGAERWVWSWLASVTALQHG